MRLSMLIGIGTLSGVAIGYFFKLVQSITENEVYTLLLNVDYIPILNSWSINEFLEFLLHVSVSVILVIVLYYSLKLLSLKQNLMTYSVINLVIGMLLWSTTVLSSRTPDLMDVAALSYWLIGHILYGSIVGLLIKLVRD